MIPLRAPLLAALLAASALAVPALAAGDDAVPTQIATVRFGFPGAPTATPFDLEAGFQWEDAGSFEVPAGLGRLFFVRSDVWLGVGYRGVDVCMTSPSGHCLTSEDPNPQIGPPCVTPRVFCESFATGSEIGEREDGVYTVSFRGVTNAEHIIRVFAW